MGKIESYTFHIMRYHRYENFDSLEALRKEVARYFTRKEQHIVDKLTDFSHARFDQYGMATNEYQDYSVTAYKEVE